MFGLESGYEVAKQAGLSAFIGMDDELAGKQAAQQFPLGITQALFVQDTSVSGRAQARRLAGFSNQLKGVAVDTLEMDGVDEAALEAKIDGCNYQAILLAHARISSSLRRCRLSKPRDVLLSKLEPLAPAWPFTRLSVAATSCLPCLSNPISKEP